MTHRVSSLDPRDFIQIKPIFLKPKAYEDQDEDQHHAPCGPTRLAWDRRGCWADPPEPSRPASTDDAPPRDDPPNHDQPRDSTGGSKSLPIPRKNLAGRREDSMCLRKHLDRARRLVSAVKQGRCYFHLLQKEAQEEREEEEERRRSGEEQLKAMARPPRVLSDSDSDDDSDRAQTPRPFTPVHRSLTSPLISEVPREAVYRQLCCLTWLLEALRPERSGRLGPVTSCWDPRDPGRARTHPRAVQRERAVETKWEQFVSVSKPQVAPPRPSRCSSRRLHLLQRSSALSLASSSSFSSSSFSFALPTSLPSGGPEEEPAAPGPPAEPAGGVAEGGEDEEEEEEEEVPVSTYLRSLLDAVRQSVRKDLVLPRSLTQPAVPRPAEPPPTSSKANMADTPRPKSSESHVSRSQVSRSLVSSRSQVSRKSSMVADLRAAQEQRLGEMAVSYADVLDHNARKRLNSGLQRYRALDLSTGSKHLPGHVTCPLVTTVTAPATGAADSNANDQRNNMWLSRLLSRLPAEVCREREVSRVLQKLSGLAGEETARVRSHHFFKVLGGLQPWELCLPDLCVAIELVRENVVQMPREEYDAWLCSRLNTVYPTVYTMLNTVYPTVYTA
ncbi:unnamed protein product [Merluccius merluccius]